MSPVEDKQDPYNFLDSDWAIQHHDNSKLQILWPVRLQIELSVCSNYNIYMIKATWSGTCGPSGCPSKKIHQRMYLLVHSAIAAKHHVQHIRVLWLQWSPLQDNYVQVTCHRFLWPTGTPWPPRLWYHTTRSEQIFKIKAKLHTDFSLLSSSHGAWWNNRLWHRNLSNRCWLQRAFVCISSLQPKWKIRPIP